MPDFSFSFFVCYMLYLYLMQNFIFRYLYLSKLVTIKGASGAVARLCLDQVWNLKSLYYIKCVWCAVCMQFDSHVYWVQFLFSPAFIGVFMALLVTLEGKPSEVMPKLKQVIYFFYLFFFLLLCLGCCSDYMVKRNSFLFLIYWILCILFQEWFPSVIANWQLWVPFQFLNFYFVPQKFQVHFIPLFNEKKNNLTTNQYDKMNRLPVVINGTINYFHRISFFLF